MTIELTEDKIPQFLKNSDLYKTLEFDSSFEDSFSIPNKYFRENTKVESLEDLSELLQVLRYWLSEEKPFDIYNFVYSNPDLDYSKIFDEFSKMKIIDEISLLWSFENTIQEHRKIKKNKIDNNVWDDDWDFSWKPDEIEKQSNFFLLGSENVDKVIFGGYMIMDGLVDLRLVVAIYKGFLGLVKFLVVDKKFNYRDVLIITAIRCNEYDIFKILIENIENSDMGFSEDLHMRTNLEIYAARSQDIRYLKYIFGNQLDKRCNGYLSVKEAAKYGRIENIKFLFEKGFNNYLYSEDCKEISYGAAKNGHLEILKFYYNNGGEFDETTIFLSPPHLECLKFLHKVGGKLDYKVLNQCLYKNSLECFKYTFEYLNPKPSLDIIMADNYYHMRMPFAHCNLEFSKYLYKNGYKVPNDILMEGCVYAKNIYKSYDNIFISPEKINDSTAEKIYCIAYIKFAFENCDDLVDMILGSYGNYGFDETDEIMKIAKEHFL